MPRWTPCKRRAFVRKLAKLGFDGPFSGTRHQFLTRTGAKLTLPGHDELPVPLLRTVLAEVEQLLGRDITLEEWTDL